MDINLRRRFYAEEIQAVSNLRTTGIVEALATVPRERFLGPGPWTIRAESDFQAPPRQTPSADPSHVYHNFAVAIDPARQLFNGAPGLLAMAIDQLGLRDGSRVLHVGSGTGYYTALIAACVGPAGRVVAIDVDQAIAARAAANLAPMPWVEVRHGDGSAPLAESFDGILVNAGVTHPLDTWLDGLADGGRLMFPLTVPMAPTIGKGLLVLLTRTADPVTLDARLVTFVAIYSALGLRSDAAGAALGEAMKSNPFPQLKRARRDPHEPGPSCWFHTASCCFSL
jgi:protein-L-isoaspartate(D-aspartate) O-methyltransferase